MEGIQSKSSEEWKKENCAADSGQFYVNLYFSRVGTSGSGVESIVRYVVNWCLHFVSHKVIMMQVWLKLQSQL